MTTQISGDTGVSQVQDGVIVAADFQAALFAASLTENGYQKLPSGLIIQWGVDKGSGSSPSGTTVFPIPFPNAIFSCIAGWESSVGESNPFVYSKTTSSFDWNRGSGSAGWITWVAIGY